MTTTFCIYCGERNTGDTAACSVCGQRIDREAVAAKQWEVVSVPVNENSVEKGRLDVLRRHPVLSVAVAVVAMGLAGVMGWIGLRDDRRPCEYYADIDCRAQVTYRAMYASQERLDRLGVAQVTRAQGEMIDWIRLFALAQGPGNRSSLDMLLDAAAGHDPERGPCFDVAECLADKELGDFDYDGLSGSLGMTFDGVPQTGLFVTSDEVAQRVRLMGQVLTSKSTIVDDPFDLEGIRIVSQGPVYFAEVEEVLPMVIQEINDLGIDLEIEHVLRSEISRLPAAPVEIRVGKSVGIGRSPLESGRTRVGVRVKTEQSDEIKHLSFELTQEHVHEASADGLERGNRVALLADCRWFPIEEGETVVESGVLVASRCVSEATDFTEFLGDPISFDRIVVMGSRSEGNIIRRIDDVGDTLNPQILALRLS